MPYEEWAVEARHRITLLQLDVLRGAGRWDAVLELDPADESAHVALMKRALAQGDYEDHPGTQRAIGLIERSAAQVDDAYTEARFGGYASWHISSDFDLQFRAGYAEQLSGAGGSNSGGDGVYGGASVVFTF